MNRPKDNIQIVQALRPKFLPVTIAAMYGSPIPPMLLTLVNLRTKRVFQQMVNL